MDPVRRNGLDLARHVWQVPGADAAGRAVLHRKLRRPQMLEFFARQHPTAAVRVGDGGLWRLALLEAWVGQAGA